MLPASTIEKPWIAAVDTFAIGGGCQHLLVMDYVLAEAGAYLTLPARKEGIIPGMANLRLPRFVGDRLARQAIMYGRRFDCDSAEGRLICDEIAPPIGWTQRSHSVVEGLTSSGDGERRRQPPRSFRIGQEPLDLFRRYLALYAKEQAYCHFQSGADRQSRAPLERQGAEALTARNSAGGDRVVRIYPNRGRTRSNCRYRIQEV